MVIQLIAKDKNENLQFQGSCKLRIDSVSKILLVEPKNEEFKMISAMFKWKFVDEKNILFVFAEHDFQDFALIFDDSKICNKVLECIIKREAICGEQILILQRFLPPFFDEISKNSGSKFKEIVIDFINSHGEKEKKEYIQLLKDHSIFELCYPEGEKNKPSTVKKRKRELNAKYKDGFIVNKSLYTIIPLNLRGNVTKNYLIIFTTEKKDFCYKFLYNKWNKHYRCSKCYSSRPRFYFLATIQNEGKENETVYLNNRKHICKPLKYSDILRASYRQIVISPNFQLIRRKTNGKIIQHLAVFTNDEKSECFEYTWSEQHKYFICQTCSTHHKIHVYARIIKNDETQEECVKLGQTEHRCKPIKYVPEDITVKIVKEPNFKLWETVACKKKVQRLTIFDSKNKHFGYVYAYDAFKKKYFCMECRKTKRSIFGKVLQDENGQNYVEMGKTEHFCKLRKL